MISPHTFLALFLPLGRKVSYHGLATSKGSGQNSLSVKKRAKKKGVEGDNPHNSEFASAKLTRSFTIDLHRG